MPSGPDQAAKKKSVSLEERLGAGVYIWVGGIALMLAGAFLVKYSFDNNLLSVQARLTIAGVFGALLVLSSLWLYERADKVAAAVCGAGVAVMFATILAATAFFDVMNPWWGFILMAVVTAVAVGMSLKHGPFVALLGLVGGFATPTLISGQDLSWGPTFTYLLLLEVGLTVITRKKQWFGLSALTLLASVITTLAYTLFAWDPDHSYWLVIFAMGTAVVFVMNAVRATDQPEAAPTLMSRIWLGLGAVGTSALLMTMFVGFSRFSMLELASLGLLGAGTLVLARFDRRYLTLTYLGAGLCGLMLLAWPVAHRIEFAELVPIDYYLVAIGYGLTFFLGGLLCVWRYTRPVVFAWLSAGSALCFVVIAHIGQPHQLPPWLSWWVVYSTVAGLVTIVAGLVWRTREKHGTLVIDAYALIVPALATLAIFFGLEYPWIAPAWCGLAVVVAAVGTRLDLRWLMIPVGWLAAGLILRLILPGPTGYTMPMRPVLNTMLLHYGLPALGFAAVAWVYHRNPLFLLRSIFQGLALFTATVAISLQIRLGFHPDHLWRDSADLFEWATYAGLWLLIGTLILWRFKAASLDGLRKTAVVVGMIGLIAAVLQLLIISNPLLRPSAVGEIPVFNGLLYIYGVPCVLACLFTWVMPKEVAPFKRAAGVVSFTLLFALVTLEVRQGFNGSDMPLRLGNRVVLYEWATYSAAWLMLAMALCWIAAHWRLRSFAWAGMTAGLIGLAMSVIGTVGIANPLFTQAEVGSLRVFNGLLYIYGLPCILAAALAYVCKTKDLPMKPIAAAVALLLLFVLVSLQVRQGFVGGDLLVDTHSISDVESYSYSLAWVLLALLLLAGGIITGSTTLRYDSLAVMLVAVGKVALDTARLEDLWRVLSLLGLGLSLIVLGYVYQRYVFQRPRQTDPALDE